ELCRSREIPLASHDDTVAEHVVEAVESGFVISEFPTTQPAARAAREHGLGIVMGAPNLVRGGSHSGNVSALTLARDDLLDCLSSDYVPHSLLHGAFLLRDQAGWSLPKAVRAVTRTPAHLVQLHDRGEVAAGKRADFVRVRELQRVPVPLRTWREGMPMAYLAKATSTPVALSAGRRMLEAVTTVRIRGQGEPWFTSTPARTSTSAKRGAAHT